MTDGVASVAGAGYVYARGSAVGIDGLGQSGRAVRLAKGCRAEYLLRCDTAGEADIVACFLPQHPAAAKTLRFRLTVDGEDRGLFDIRETFGEEPWKVNVLRNQARRGVRLHLSEGVHRIGVEPIDEPMLLDGIFIDRLHRDPYVPRGFIR